MIKVADFGLTEDMYGTNYFRRTKNETGSDEKVPIRWMAPESIENDVYTEATDVVSYKACCCHGQRKVARISMVACWAQCIYAYLHTCLLR